VAKDNSEKRIIKQADDYTLRTYAKMIESLSTGVLRLLDERDVLLKQVQELRRRVNELEEQMEIEERYERYAN
jgi:hypothetical protein